MAFQANKAYRRRSKADTDNETTENYTMMQAFDWHSPKGLWKQLESQVDMLADMGITAFWLPPPTKGSSPEDVGYGIYDLWDLGEFDQKGSVATKYGTKEELQSLIAKAKDAGIVCYCDAVLNHRLGGDETEKFLVKEVDQQDRTKDISGKYDIEGWTGFNFAGRSGKHSELKLKSYHFSGVDFDNATGKKGVFRIMGDGKTWAKDVSNEQGNFDYLMGADLDESHPEVREDTFNWGCWIIDEFGFAGFRFDAVKHISQAYIRDFIKEVRKRTGKPDLFAVGELWEDNTPYLNKYLADQGQQFSLFDTPLHYNFKQADDQGSNFDIRKVFDDSLCSTNPTDAVTLVDNHDTQKGQSLQSWIGGPFKPISYALILLREAGYPCVFAGDLFGIKTDEEGAAAEPASGLASFIRARKLFAFGEQRDYWDHANCVGWVRVGDKDHDGCAVIVSNGDEGEKHMQTSGQKGEEWTDVLGWHQGTVTIGDDGWGDFHCPASSVSIWTKKDARGRDTFK
ncbi:glycoside hydrolase family 13 protein [Mixia osmundae IAM 14324]|uniref:Glycosyl hydrolase family 13 catalytic domain-containing protein n=1 Tax=Mixia osmundae (strain CBS 9802 / IAM 14324 / JCM 22182 / KY 12970) TaxID=764103 RepID=G7E2I4_MIXOS|nr:glycoside hydrolase family 13 protein [Mixia osmundae IAM 14324]KEI36916.1 glycoside hydrolase family 13 protein [Mixia osmundae IAM 14324]GAA97044.1 hypothetical protein E5Q_03719 [Mixia osmundae IAM 14324]